MIGPRDLGGKLHACQRSELDMALLAFMDPLFVFKVVYFGGTLCSITSANDWSKQIRRRSGSGRPHSVVL